MAPDLALLVLVAVYIALTALDLISSWTIEKKSRSQAEANSDGTSDVPRTAGARQVTRFRTRTSLFMVAFELCLCGVMLGAIATWYFYAIALVQESTFKTKCVGMVERDLRICCSPYLHPGNL